MALVKNISTGPRGAWHKGELITVEAGQTIEADDFADEWFEVVKAGKGSGKKGAPNADEPQAELVVDPEPEPAADATAD